MEAFIWSSGAVALAEIGDKTQLLAFVLAARFRRPWPIIWAILLATIANHGVAALLGEWLSELVSPQTLKYLVGASFIGMGLWILVPDKLEEETVEHADWGVFLATFVAFFLAEIGDKTQIATIALAAHYQSLVAVVMGTTLGMMLANVPAVILGDRATGLVSVRLVHSIAALMFIGLGLAVLLGFDGWGTS
ncbi:MAG: TMEM165/GDT1 family protein [Pseudohongiellaceae bacterium]|nr:TMEM165/GDT1 family protein [Pseudohongiellaceae bacterium]